MKIPVLLAGCAFCATTMADEPGRTATVDIARVVESYTPLYDALRKSTVDYAFRIKRKEHLEAIKVELPQLYDEWTGLQREIDRLSASKTDRKAAREKLEQCATRIRELDKEMQLCRAALSNHGRWEPGELRKMDESRARTAMTAELKDVISALSIRERYQTVLPYSPATPPSSPLPPIVWANPKTCPDITGDVIHELNRRDAIRRNAEWVLRATVFTLGPNGGDGELSLTEQTLRQMMTLPDAVEQCEWLIQKGTPAGKLYGALGLHLQGLPQDSLKGAAAMQKDATAVEAAQGCRRYPSSVAAEMREIAAVKR